EGGDVGSKEVLVGPDADDERALVSRPDDLARFVRMDRQDRIRSAGLVQRLPGRLLQVPLVKRLDQVDEALRVRLADERVPAGLQLLPQARLVLDDPVAGQLDLPR